MTKKYDVVLVVITRERITTRAIDGDGLSIEEVYQKTRSGEIDCISGNFEDEADLPEGLMEALTCLQGPTLAVLEELNASLTT